ncbi:MAG: hypothetical protein QNK37_12590 [Acidobacteriota bacterium]|nr:hypothetical protein [Acidobacteriota bacterium]
MLLLIVGALWFGVPAEGRLQRQVVSFPNDEFYFEFCRDLMAMGDFLYVLENRKHRLYKLRLSPKTEFIGTLAAKGEGPGELWQPVQLINRAENGFAVKESRGFSLFDARGGFEKRFRVFTPWISAAWANDRLFFVTAEPNREHLIDIYSPDGARSGSFLNKFLDVTSASGEYRQLATNEQYFYSGQLETDGKYLYYLSITTGRFFKLDLEGNIVLERDASDDFGPHGRYILDKNKEYLAEPARLEASEGFIEYQQFRDAYLHNGKIYILRWVNYEETLASPDKHILVFDTKDFTLEERLTFTMVQGEFAFALAVTGSGKDRRIYTVMDTRKDDIQLVMLTP